MQTGVSNAVNVDNVCKLEKALKPIIKVLNKNRDSARFTNKLADSYPFFSDVKNAYRAILQESDNATISCHIEKELDKKVDFFYYEFFHKLNYRAARFFRKIPSHWQFSTLEWIEIAVALDSSIICVAARDVDSLEKEFNASWENAVDVGIIFALVDIAGSRENFISLVKEVNDLGNVIIVLNEEKIASRTDFLQNFTISKVDYTRVREYNALYLEECIDFAAEHIKQNYTPEVPLSLFFDVFFDNVVFSQDERFEFKEKSEMLSVLRNTLTKGAR